MKNGSIQLIIRVNNLAKEGLYLNFSCNKDKDQLVSSKSTKCFKGFEVSEKFSEVNLNKWQTVNIPIHCLGGDDFELSSISTRTQIQTIGNWDIDIHSIKYISNQGYNSCKIYTQDYE